MKGEITQGKLPEVKASGVDDNYVPWAFADWTFAHCKSATGGISWQAMFTLLICYTFLEVYHDIFSEWNWLSRLKTVLYSGTTPKSDLLQQSPKSWTVRKCKKGFACSNLALLKMLQEASSWIVRKCKKLFEGTLLSSREAGSSSVNFLLWRLIRSSWTVENVEKKV